MKLTDYIVDELKREGTDVIFGYTGGSIADFIDSVGKRSDVTFVQNYSEQGSAFSANAYAQVTGKIGVAVSSSGPGAINLLNGIANAYFDSIPCLFITGNVHTLGRRPDDSIRQNAFQETDIVSMTKGITKDSIYLDDASRVVYELQRAIRLVREGRPGPVVIDIPYDVQRAEINIEELEQYIMPDEDKPSVNTDLFYERLNASKRPLILVGGGCQSCKEELAEFLGKKGIPVVASLRGLGLVTEKYDNYVGFIGSYGNYIANAAIAACDLLLVLGSRLDERQAGYIKERFAPKSDIIQVDVDAFELGRKSDNYISYNCDVKEFLKVANLDTEEYRWQTWSNLLAVWKKRFNAEADNSLPNALVKAISDICCDRAVYTTDVGQNQMLCAQSLSIKDNIFLTSAGLGCMGYSLPAAVGAYYGCPDRDIIAFTGDGGLMMNLQELQTAKRDNIPLKLVVLNNSCLGMIRRLQDNMFEGRYYASVEGYREPDIKAIAKAFEMDYYCINEKSDVAKVEDRIRDDSAVVIEVVLPLEMKVEPEPGKTIDAQESVIPDKLIGDFYEAVKLL